MSIAKEIDEALVKHFEIPADIQQQASFATWDLYHGPSGGGLEDEDEDGEPLYLGFSEACTQVSEWCDDNLSEVWYDIQSGEVLEREPQGEWIDDYEDEDEEVESVKTWCEPSWEDYYHCPLSDVKGALFDKELVQYI